MRLLQGRTAINRSILSLINSLTGFHCHVTQDRYNSDQPMGGEPAMVRSTMLCRSAG